MRSTRSLRLWAKGVIAMSAMFSLAVIAASKLAPATPLGTALLYAALGAVAGLLALVVASVIIATLAQFVLKHGGTDAQWFWFNGEPRGLRWLRADARAESSQGFHSGDRGS